MTAAARAPRLRIALACYASYVAGVALATFPLVLAPGRLWPHHHDPRLFTWVMAGMARWLASGPRSLFDGNAFYPYGRSLAWSEPLLVPAALGLPGFLAGAPVLTYNLLVLLLWPANGLAMAWAAHALTGSRPAAWLAGAVFCLSPYFTEYHLEFNMLPAVSIPLALVAWVRWLERQEPRWLGLALGALALQGLTTWYYAIILGLGLTLLAAGVLALRWRGWLAWQMLSRLALGGLAVSVVLLPVALPYLEIHDELGYERSLADAAAHVMDLAAFVLGTGPRGLLHANRMYYGETSGFVGWTALALAVASLTWLRPDRLRRVVVARRLARWALAASFPVVLAAVWRGARLARQGGMDGYPLLAVALWLPLGLGLGVLLLRGLGWARARAPRRLEEGDWVRLLWLLTGAAAVLALGPMVQWRGMAIGAGPYADVYRLLFPLHAIRITARFAVLTTAGLAFLAALGWRRIEAGLASRPGARRVGLALVVVALMAEYAVVPPRYDLTRGPRPVDAALRAEREDVAVLEFPAYTAGADTDAMFYSLYHGKRVVNGHSGFIPASLRDLSGLLSRPTAPELAGPEAPDLLRRIHPLRYLVVREASPDLGADSRAAWQVLRGRLPPWLRHRGTYGSDDLYELVTLPERGVRIERWIADDVVRRYPVLELELGALEGGAARREFVDVWLDDELAGRVAIDPPRAVRLRLPAPRRAVAPSVVTLTYGYTRPESARDARFRIGATGVVSPGDLWVESAGQPHGNTAVIRFNGADLALDRRGYNLVALSPAGTVLGRATFDTFFERAAPRQLATWVGALPAGTVVAGAVRDEASGRLTEDAVRALASVGVAGDLRGRFRESHAFVGAKGAPPGSAVEQLGARRVAVRVGRPGDLPGFELTRFALHADAQGS